MKKKYPKIRELFIQERTLILETTKNEMWFFDIAVLMCYKIAGQDTMKMNYSKGDGSKNTNAYEIYLNHFNTYSASHDN